MTFMFLVAVIVRNRRIWPEKNNTKEYATIGTTTTQPASLGPRYASASLKNSPHDVSPIMMPRKSNFVMPHVGDALLFYLI